MKFFHEPIMLKEIIEALALKPSGVFVDCTIGGAGHSLEIIKYIPNGKLIGIDKDDDALKYAHERLKNYSNFILVKNDFKDIENILNELQVNKVDGFLLDLGVSSHQIDSASRGFSFRFEGPLDMRMDKSQELSAFEIINYYSREELMKILRNYGEEKFANLIVNNILKHRQKSLIKTTKELNDIIEECLPKKIVYKSGGAAKKTFQALRIAVNNELIGLDKALNNMIDRLNIGGRIFVLTFHSLEDRIVKNVFKFNSLSCTCPPETPICICNHKQKVKLITKKPLVASKFEKNNNPRSTSAKLRIAEKV